MKKNYTIFERIQKITLSFTLVVTSLVILVLLWQINISFNYKFIIELIAVIILFTFSTFIIVINEIPKSLPRKFDMIKNKIANREIKSIEEFCNEFNDFLIHFFNYISFDIEFAAVQIKENKLIFSDEKLKSLKEKLYDKIELTKQQTSPIQLGKVLIDNKKYFGYIIPIHFGEEWLGYFSVFTKSSLNKIYLDFLDDFENDYLDDQLVHVIEYNKI